MPLDDLVRVIETLQQRIRDHGDSLRQNEIRTRVALIDPLLTALGWDVSDPGLVTAEYDVNGKRADYALLDGQGNPVVFLEAKRLDEPLSNHRSQVVAYASELGIRYPALTNGKEWEVYDNSKLVPIGQRLILNASVDSDLPATPVLQFLLLWRPNMASGQPTNANEPILTQNQDTSEHPTLSATIANTTTGEPVLTSLKGWSSLAEFEVKTGTTPPVEIRFPDGNQKPIAIWRHIEERTVEWLWQKELLNLSHLPVPSSKKRYIVNSSAQHPTGDAFKYSVNVSGTPLVIEGNISSIASYRNTIRLLEHCGQSAASVYLRLS